jgi:AcrR family transcriptional regulator
MAYVSVYYARWENMDNNIMHRKERLIITTIEIIDELGIQGLSTREIARRQGVSEATLFRHFRSKNDLLNAVLEYYSQFDSDIFQSTRMKKLHPKEAIIFYITSFTEYYENYPAITSIMHLSEVLRYEDSLKEKVVEILNRRTYFLVEMIEDAKKYGIVQPGMNSENIATIITGICREICLKWRLERDFLLKERTLGTLALILDAFFRA